jgi:hypothetical protein
MKRTPHAPDVVIGAEHILAADAAVLVAAVLGEALGLEEDLAGGEVAHADLLFAAVDVEGAQGRVAVRARARADLDLRVGAREGGQQPRRQERVHPPAAAPVVAVVQVQPLALQDEGAHAVLGGGWMGSVQEVYQTLGGKGRGWEGRRTRLVAMVLMPLAGITPSLY